MKIVQLITRMDAIGGAQIHVRDLCLGLKKSGHSVQIITGGTENFHKELERYGIKIDHCQPLMRELRIVADIQAFFEVRRIIKRIQPDLIATHSSKAGIIGRVIGWTLRIPTLFTAHGWAFTEGVERKKRKMYGAIEKVIGCLTDKVITVSDYDRQLAINHKILPHEKVVTIHNGVLEQVCPKHEVDADNILQIVMVARFAPPKQQLNLINALKKIQQLEWNMVFVGDGPTLSEARALVISEGLANRVQFLGNRDDVIDILQRCHLFVLLSDWEGLPLSILEAMQCGLPIITSDVGGVKEAVKQSENGFVIPKIDEGELLNKLTLLLTDSSLRSEMGKQSRIRYEQDFKFEQMLKKTIRCYQDVIDMKRANSFKKEKKA